MNATAPTQSQKRITKQQAMRELGLTEWMVDDFAKNGYPALGIKPGRFTVKLNKTRRPVYRFLQTELQRVAAHRKEAEVSGEGDLVTVAYVLKNPISIGKDEYKFEKKTLHSWVDKCLFLGRPIGHDYLGRQEALHISWSDLNTIARMLNNPYGWQLPGNDGAWIGEGIYRCDDAAGKEALWFSAHKLEELNAISFSLWANWAHRGHPALDPHGEAGRVRCLSPLWPSRKLQHDGKVRVYHEDDVKKIVEWRTKTNPTEKLPGAEGAWLAEGMIWRDDKGRLWLSNKHLRQACGVSELVPDYWRRNGLLEAKKVPCAYRAFGGIRKRMWVYLESSWNRLRENAEEAKNTTQAPEVGNQGKTPKRKIWLDWKDAGKTYGEIVIAWYDQTREKVSRDAIKTEVIRLRKRLKTGGGSIS
jgi:hypothetical protein